MKFEVRGWRKEDWEFKIEQTIRIFLVILGRKSHFFDDILNLWIFCLRTIYNFFQVCLQPTINTWEFLVYDRCLPFIINEILRILSFLQSGKIWGPLMKICSLWSTYKWISRLYIFLGTTLKSEGLWWKSVHCEAHSSEFLDYTFFGDNPKCPSPKSDTVDGNQIMMIL